MNNFQYYNPVEMIFGRGLESTVGEHVVRYGGTKKAHGPLRRPVYL